MPLTVHCRGRLPHWELDGALYFVTFRTADAVSPALIAGLRLSRFTPDKIRNEVELTLDSSDRGDILRGHVAKIVTDSVLFGHERDYDLDTWCVMPNHVHLLFRHPRSSLARTMQTLKSSTAHRINAFLNRDGPVWEREYFDRIVRPGQAEPIRRYILDNPRRANLPGWSWSGRISAGVAPAPRLP